MREVTGKEFFEVVGKLDVTVTPKGNYPYRTDFCLRNGVRAGYIQEIDLGGFVICRHYLCGDKREKEKQDAGESLYRDGKGRF